jgi:hypothetical protein
MLGSNRRLVGAVPRLYRITATPPESLRTSIYRHYGRRGYRLDDKELAAA